jgi:DNA-binding SARP family transcriptional activator
VAPRPLTRIELLGGFRILRDGVPFAAVPTPRQQEIIAYLILDAGSVLPRQRVAGSLWPESTDQQALTNLRRELHHLRENWPDVSRLLDARPRTLAWRGEADITEFDAAPKVAGMPDRASLEAVAQLYKGDLLPDCAAEWIENDRERLRRRAVSALAHLVDLLEKDGAFVDAIARGEQLIRLDPLREEAWCALMRCHARRGERAAALHVYQQCAALLKRELGVQPSVATRVTYREILAIDDAASAPPAVPRTAVYPLVGRDEEWRTLLRVWRESDQGRARMVVLRGEAGIGKTRLTEELIDWCRVKNVCALTARCYAGEGRLAYAPIAAWLRSASLQPTLTALPPAVLSDVARLHPDVITARPDVQAPDRQLEHWQRLRFFDSIAQAFRAATPLVMVLDDLQWADADTIEWLQYFLQSASEARYMIAGTVRAEEEQDNAPLGRLLRQLAQETALTVIPLGPLDLEATAQLAGAVAEHDVDADTLARTFRDTEGHPLFIVERGRIESGGHSSTSNALSRVQSVVAARLALLSPDARAVAEAAAAVGRDFTFDILAHASDLDEAALVRALDELWRRQIVRVQADAHWDFSHDRIREVAYSGLGPARAPLVHRRIARGMEAQYADRLDEVSAAIAVHLDRGGQPARAVPFLQRAAAVATQVSANEEAVRCLTYALSLLVHLPAGRDRDDLELAIRSSLSMALNSARGYADPDVERNLDHLFVLFRRHGNDAAPVRWLWAAFTLRFMLSDLDGARKVAEEALARAEFDPSCRCEAHHAMAGTLCSMAELEASRTHFEAALAAYDEQHPRRSPYGSDLGVFAHAWFSHTLWLLGEDDPAVAHADAAIALARRLDHVYGQALALAYASMLHQMRGDVARMLDCAEAAVGLCDRYGFGYYGDWARVLIGWAHGREQPAEGIKAIESALARLDARRAQARRPYYLSLLADTYRTAARPERAAGILDHAIAGALARSDVWWLPALYVQKSELEPVSLRDATLRRGLSLATSQHSRSLEERILALG